MCYITECHIIYLNLTETPPPRYGYLEQLSRLDEVFKTSYAAVARKNICHVLAATVSELTPDTYEKAIDCSHAAKWKISMDDEMSSHEKMARGGSWRILAMYMF